ncbi:unnamed protein product [Lathyrus sativus]|nr:unnamed protein product [Lathyrus sativus]
MENIPVMLDEQKRRRQCCLSEERDVSIGPDWVRQFLDMSDEELTEVVSSGEVNKPNVDVEEDDDDCVILDGDPEKQVTHVNDSPNGSDELLVVGEKGQIACRDYPHPRHLCATFPYSSTPHERYCAQCHCYVCDSPAPCLKWGNGLLTTDHCHATDRSETWKTLRKDSKRVKNVPLPASTNNGTLGNVVNSQHNRILPFNNAPLSSNSMLMNQTSRTKVLCMRGLVNLTPQNQATHLSSNSMLTSLTSRSMALRACPVNLTPQNQAACPITMNACSSQRSILQQNHALWSTEMHPFSGNFVPQNQASQPIRMNAINALSSLSSRLHNQGSNSIYSRPLSDNFVHQNQASQRITVKEISSLNSRLQNQISRSNNVLGCSTDSNLTIPNGTNNSRYQEPGSTLVRNRYPSHTAPRMSLGVQSHLIQKKPGHRVNRIDSIGIGNTAATNCVTPLSASSFINHVNPPHGDRNHAAATEFSNSRNCYAHNNDVLIAQTINLLLAQPNHSPAYETQPCYQSNNNLSPYGYCDIQANDSLSSYLARLNKNEHEIGNQNENIINSGARVQNVFQQKPDGGIENEGFIAKESNTNENISYVENLVSNANECSTPFSGNTHLSLDEIKHWLLDSN